MNSHHPLSAEHFHVSDEAAGYRLELYDDREKELPLAEASRGAMRPASCLGRPKLRRRSGGGTLRL